MHCIKCWRSWLEFVIKSCRAFYCNYRSRESFNLCMALTSIMANLQLSFSSSDWELFGDYFTFYFNFQFFFQVMSFSFIASFVRPSVRRSARPFVYHNCAIYAKCIWTCRMEWIQFGSIDSIRIVVDVYPSRSVSNIVHLTRNLSNSSKFTLICLFCFVLCSYKYIVFLSGSMHKYLFYQKLINNSNKCVSGVVSVCLSTSK